MQDYQEHEIKVLDIDIQSVQKKLEEVGAQKVFDDDRTITTFDNLQKTLHKENIDIRITQEGKTKLSLDRSESNGTKSSIKLTVSRKQEMQDFLAAIAIYPIAEVTAHRISYEWENVDFDIDTFPHIPPFLEIDFENYQGKKSELLSMIDLKGNKILTCSTIDLFKEYSLDYFQLFKTNSYHCN